MLGWFDWNYVAKQNFAYKGFYTNLIQAAGTQALLQSQVDYEKINYAPCPKSGARSKSVASPKKRPRLEPLRQPEDLDDSSDEKSPKLQEGPLPKPGEDPSESSKSHSDSEASANSTEDGEEDPAAEASSLTWFSQANSDVAHFYRESDSNRNPIPICRCSKKR